ncbi:MAG: putative porin, partial [Verrucomicrobiota bacterium]
MKTTKSTQTTRAALFAGAAALMSFAPVTYAQSSDALINKLEQKGILSADEAKELREESRQDFNSGFTNSFDKAFGKITGMPDWVTGYKLSGDFRGRFDDFTGDNPDFPDRIRLRYRLRAGLTVNMKDDLQVGFRVGSADAAPGTGYGGNPNSNNSTLQDDFTKKSIYIDAAYGKWMPINDGTWMLATTIGKMDNPFALSPMVFDPDLTPEGAALQGGYKFNDTQSLVVNGAAFVLDEQKLSSQDPFMYGAQLLWIAKWTPRLESSLGIAAFDIVNPNMLTVDSVPVVNLGNTRKSVPALTGGLNAATYGLAYNYNPIIGDFSVTYTLDSFPLYRGKFPVKLAAEFMDNPGAPSNNEGYW